MAVQIAGFVVGCALVGWCAVRAFHDGADGLAKLREADPALVATLLGATLVSTICSGLTFQALARPVHRFGFLAMQAVNLMASLFNYAPVRLGLVLRLGFHWKVDRMPLTTSVAWLAAVALVTFGTLASAIVAGLAQLAAAGGEAALDLIWFATYFGCLALGATTTVLLCRTAGFRKLLRGGERVLTDPRAFAGGLAFRTVDLAMWGVRMWAAAKIVGLTLSPAQAVLLAAVAILGAGNPLGRIGWREALVAVVAPMVATSAADGQDLDALFAQLALLESAGEAAVAIPLGILGAIWCGQRLRRIPSSA